VQQALSLTRASLDEARRSVLDLRAAPLEGRSLAEALAALATTIEKKHELPVRYSVDRRQPAAAATGRDWSLPRGPEALQNVVQHARASEASVELLITPDGLELVIVDNGCGFDPAAAPAHRYGLVGMNERAPAAWRRAPPGDGAGRGYAHHGEFPANNCKEGAYGRDDTDPGSRRPSNRARRARRHSQHAARPPGRRRGGRRARKCWQQVGAEQPDVVLLDLEMPRLDGVDTLRRLRERHPQTRVIIFTAFDTDERILAAVQAGAQGYLLKGRAAARGV
jgi:CheY-like chemotaxis protein